jgi:hypothetical protein
MENCTHQCNVFDPELDSVFDEMLDRMQAPGQREAMDEAFHATPEELGQSAKDYATWCRDCCYGSHCLGAKVNDSDPDCGCCG